MLFTNYVALAQNKPEQILIEEANMLAHLVQAHNTSLTLEERVKSWKRIFKAKEFMFGVLTSLTAAFVGHIIYFLYKLF